MTMEKYEGTALDTSVFEPIDVQPEAEPTPQTDVVEAVEPKPTEVVEPTTPPETKPTDKIVVEGLGEFTIDEIKELKQAGLRQADLRV